MRIDNPVHEITLVYIDDVVEELILVLKEKVAPNANNFLTVQPEYRISLSGLADTLKKFHESRIGLLHNYDRSDPFVAKLYATYLSYLPQENLAISADMKHDDRGFFAELIKSSCFGQISVSRTRPGISRGSHWHNTKVEKFIVIEGEAVIKFRKIGDSEVFEYAVSGKNIQIIDIPPGYTHSITNVGSQDVLTIFWAGELFDPDKPDTYYQEV